MTRAKFIGAYPNQRSTRKNMPSTAIANLTGKFVATRVLQSPQGNPPFYRIAEVYFPSMEALRRCAATPGGQTTLAHAAKISSGGPPVIMIVEEDTFTF
jgi:hypothetical protein